MQTNKYLRLPGCVRLGYGVSRGGTHIGRHSIRGSYLCKKIKKKSPCPGCRFDPPSGPIQELTDECINNWNNESVVFSLKQANSKVHIHMYEEGMDQEARLPGCKT